VFALYCAGKTDGIFQFESAGMRKILRQAKPGKIEDLIALNALFRPGPMDNIPQFIEGKFYPEKIHYPHPCLKDILEETYGVIVYQEQVMQIVRDLSGYSLGAADLLRRAMGKKKIEVMKAEKEKFIKGAVEKGFNQKLADDIFELLLPFAGYGFNKSHAAAYSVLSYQTAYLRVHFPEEFIAATLTNTTYNNTDNKLAQYIENARSDGMEITHPDINSSGSVFEVIESGGKRKIVFGLLGIKGVGEAAAEEIISERDTNGKYKSFIEFLLRCSNGSVNKKAIEVLIKTGCFDDLGENRATLLLNMEKASSFAEKQNEDKAKGQSSLFGGAGNAAEDNTVFVFEKAPDFSLSEKLSAEMELIGTYVSGHPLDPYRERIKKCATITTANISSKIVTLSAPQTGDNKAWKNFKEARENRARHTIIGIIKNLKKIVTKKDGKKMAFASLEDLHGTIELVFFPKVWEELEDKIQEDMIAALFGTPEEKDGKPSMQVEKLLDADNLQERKRREVHIQLESVFANDTNNAALLEPVKEFINNNTGACTVFIHIPEERGITIVRCNGLRINAGDEQINELKEFSAVRDAWWE